MDDTEKMRSEFWNTLCSISDYSAESIAKLNATFTVPKSLCRFRSVNTNTLWQLENNTQFFSTANYYDDPFDTYFKIDFEKLKKDYDFLNEFLANGDTDSMKGLLSVINIKDADGFVKSLLQNPLNIPKMNQNLNDVRNLIQKSIWSICFCEDHLNETMWLKYADNHRGFAVTYNFHNPETNLCGKEEKCEQCGIKKSPPQIYPIYYSEQKYDATIYALSLMILANLGADSSKLPDALQSLIDLSGHWQWHRISLIKKKCHHYDKEWRLLSLVPYSNSPRIKLKPESVIIGLRTKQTEADLIISSAKKAGIKKISKIAINSDNDLISIPILEE